MTKSDADEPISINDLRKAAGLPEGPLDVAELAAVDFVLDVLGIQIMPWQRWLLIHALTRVPPPAPTSARRSPSTDLTC